MTDDSKTAIEESTLPPIDEKHNDDHGKTSLSDLSWKYKLVVVASLLTLSGKHLVNTFNQTRHCLICHL